MLAHANIEIFRVRPRGDRRPRRPIGQFPPIYGEPRPTLRDHAGRLQILRGPRPRTGTVVSRFDASFPRKPMPPDLSSGEDRCETPPRRRRGFRWNYVVPSLSCGCRSNTSDQPPGFGN
jgi:hypothetical protein